MPRTPILTAAALLAASPLLAAAEAPDAREILERATEKARSLTSVRYKAEAELTSSTSRRIVRGTVAMSRFDYTDAVGGQLAVRGEAGRAGSDTVKRFEVTYDGQRVQRLRPAMNTLLQGDVYYGGEALLTGTSRFLVIKELLAPKPYERERGASDVRAEGRESVGGVDCHVVEVMLEAGNSVRWHFGVDDALPRRYENRYIAASGKPVTSILRVQELATGVELPADTFAIEPPADAKVEQVGRRPPPPLRVGEPTPDFTLQDPEGVSYQLSSLRGQVVLIEFFSTNCPNCASSVPSMQRIHESYESRGASVLAIHCRDGTGADPVGFVRGGGNDYTVLLEGNGVANQYSVRAIPLILVVGPDGSLLFQQTGYTPGTERQLRTIIEQNLPG